jgi:uncharacterized PurR-regulated membrane protein YhhQ (DUF165 family)
MKKWGFLAGYIATIPLANWMIGNVGTFCIPDGPCMIPLGFGLTAPSGVLMIGLALVLRDFVHDTLGAKWALGAILVGALLSYLLADPFIAVASLVAFAVSELSDFAVYAPIRKRNRSIAILASGVVGSIVDSALFLYLAFGSLAYVEGQIVGKLAMTVLVVLFLPIVKENIRHDT